MVERKLRTNVTLYDAKDSIIKVHYDVEGWQINENGWIYIKEKSDEISDVANNCFIYNRDIVGHLEIDHK